MNLIKSIGVGLLSAVAGLFLMLLCVVGYALLTMPPLKENETIGWDLVSFARTSLPWIVALVSFVAGFAWEYRRLLRR